MTYTDAERRRSRRKDLLYKNLEHISDVYSLAEGAFPFWEAAFALINGQIILAYFNPNICNYQQKWLAVIGCIISYIWFFLVSLNFQNALHMNKKLKCLYRRLDSQFRRNDRFRGDRFVRPYPDDKDKKKWTLRKIIQGTKDEEPINLAWINKISRSTWFYRRLLPFVLLLIWIYLLAQATGGEIMIIPISIIITIATIILFDP